MLDKKAGIILLVIDIIAIAAFLYNCSLLKKLGNGLGVGEIIDIILIVLLTAVSIYSLRKKKSEDK